MNRTLLIASLLASLTAAVHIILGGPDIVTPLLSSALDTEPRLVLYACWHSVSAALALSAVGLFIAAQPRFAERAQLMVLAISVWWLAVTAVFLAIIVLQPGDGLLWKLPQWALLAPVGLLGLWASVRRAASR